VVYIQKQNMHIFLTEVFVNKLIRSMTHIYKRSET